MSEKLITVRTAEGMRTALDAIKDCQFVALDTETTGVDRDSSIIGYSVCGDVNEAYYIVTRYWDVEQQKLVVLETEKESPAFMASLIGRNLVLHNAPFDCAMIKNNYGIELMPSVHTDSMLLCHILNENSSVGLKEMGVALFGADAKAEQAIMKESISKNGGVLTKAKYELYKADSELIARYGAKDTILTLKIFYTLVPKLFEEGLDAFFYDDECMPLLRGPTYDMNTTGLRVDVAKLELLKRELETEILETKAAIYQEITPLVKDKYPGTKPSNTINIGGSTQLSWLLFMRLGNPFNTLTRGGKELCKALGLKVPYTAAAKRQFIQAVEAAKGQTYTPIPDKKWEKPKPKKVRDPWVYMACGKESLTLLANKYKWVGTLLEHAKAKKLLSTYVIGIQERMRYGIIRPSFLQHGTTSGRYSSRNPNFQNLPRGDKRVKACVVARPGNVFVGADQAQLEPRVFASVSGDERLMACFSSGEDFYSVVGAPIFGKHGLPLGKDDPGSFAQTYPKLRDQAKVVALATPYGRTAMQQSTAMGITPNEAQDLIDKYFAAYPKVELMMLESHQQAKDNGVVHSIYGRPRRIPEAREIPQVYGKSTPHGELPYVARTLLNLGMNHRVQSTGASIMNRAAIAVWQNIQTLAEADTRWKDVKIVMQVHDELILEGPAPLAEDMAIILRDGMENTVKLPGVALVADPKIANNLADLK